MPITRARDAHGRFRPGHDIGKDTRFKPGQPCANPKGRPWGVNKWVRILRSRRYHRPELEAVVADDHAPANQREAAVRLLMPLLAEQMPLEPPTKLRFNEMQSMSNEELRFIAADPREPWAMRVAAWGVVRDRLAES